ncbi:L,D-transpeptidase [Phormidesmis priestleyi ULC007]|uniref:L,D-transpeptidase n=1 Tax=Phormidesmis priestleyi ULC007 TaxID=1920490 RepID=A0A2T1DCA0_9CYAN|nr:L,D-transpeptidase [Phormidesmis priestleyi]PSB18130.1 L,D-transpeptidase [Phormidesmis priestleyi ULC007]PZO49600.1 MAG: L,D-transpeptidase [Phormidesmis priestleyi]
MKKYFSKPSYLFFVAAGLALALQTSLILRSKVHPDRVSQVPQPPAISTTPTPLASPQVAPDLTPRLVISLSNRRVTLYSGKTQIKSYPIAVGRAGWETPTGEFKVMDMQQNPTWINPFTGKPIASGDPKNPLGAYWIGFWTDGNNWIGFHGTPEANSVGQAASHGCIRMYNRDIEALFQQVSLGTSVRVVP